MGGGILAEVCAQYFFYKVYFMYFMYLLYIRRIGPVTGIVRLRLGGDFVPRHSVHVSSWKRTRVCLSPQQEDVAVSLLPAPWRMYPSVHGLTLVALQYSFINDVCVRLYVFFPSPVLEVCTGFWRLLAELLKVVYFHSARHSQTRAWRTEVLWVFIKQRLKN